MPDTARLWSADGRFHEVEGEVARLGRELAAALALAEQRAQAVEQAQEALHEERAAREAREQLQRREAARCVELTHEARELREEITRLKLDVARRDHRCVRVTDVCG